MSKHKFNIILDLDETLLSTVDIKDKKDLEGVTVKDLKVLKKNKDALRFDDYLITPRPHLQEFLDFLFKNFNVSIWTAASKEYACFIANELITPRNKSKRKLSCFFFDTHRDISEKIYKAPKKLETLWQQFKLRDDFNKKNTIIIDDLPDVKNSQPEYTYQIPAFDVRKNNYVNDEELKTLMKLLSENLKDLTHSYGLNLDSARRKITMQTV
jgi:TFIIF-interacting CTD phosphatase-like protein